VTLFSGDANSFQTTIYSLIKDTQTPNTPASSYPDTLKYYTNYSAGTELDSSQYQYWQKQPVTAVITCHDAPGSSDGSSCACASTLLEPVGQQFWSPGVPSASGPDMMTYTRILLNNTGTVSDVQIRDTA